MDIAGLVKGAAEGQGLGNNFLSHIGACDGIFHLCRKYAEEKDVPFQFIVEFQDFQIVYCSLYDMKQ